MPSIKSELTNQSFASRPTREYIIPNAEDDFAPLPSSIPGYTPPPASFNTPAERRAFAINSAAQNQAQIPAPPPNYYAPTPPRQPSLEELQATEDAYRRAKAIKNGTSRLTAAAKSRIEMLCGISRMFREVEIDGQSYVLRTLKSQENREALLAASKFDGAFELTFEVRRQQLARSLTTVGGTDVELFLGDNSLEARLEMVDLFDELVLVKLYDEYNSLFNEMRDKYFIKSETEAKEVIEDLGK